MKGILLSLLATLVGLAMVAGGIYGVAQSGDGEEDDSSAGPATTPVFPGFVSTPTRAGACDAAAERDFRLGSIESLRLAPAGDNTGSADVRAICNGETVVLSIRLQGLRAKKSSSYYVWLYAGRRYSKQIGTLLGSNGNAFGSATIAPDLDTSAYDRIVITRADFGESQKRPRGIVFAGGI